MKSLLLIVLLSHGADSGVTHAVRSPGVNRELLLTSNPWVTDGLIAGSATFQLAVFKKWHKKNPKTIWTLALVGAGVRGWAVYHNLHTVRKGRE